MDRRYFSAPLDWKAVRVTDGFWHAVQETVRTEVIPYQWEALNDRVPGAEPSYCMHNFKAAARLLEKKRSNGAFVPPSYTYRGFQTLPEDPHKPDPDRFYGFLFQDTDFSKWIEAVAYSLTQYPDPELERAADEAIELVCAAQDDSGYLDTYYIINGMDRVFTNLRDHHELYCLGHLAEGAVAYYQATGKNKLLKAACRFADFAAERFGPESGKRKGYPGHEIAEMGLVRLYEATGEEKYRKLSQFFLDQRGTQPYYFDQEAQERAAFEGKPWTPDENPSRYAYHQAHLPVREQGEAVGHAVRAGYLYAGMADMVRLTGDEGMFTACRRLWDSIVKEKLYITGGVGGTHFGEAFSYPFDLPNDTAYSETCAAIALAFFARRMLEIEPRAEYADVMELALYNTVLAGMALAVSGAIIQSVLAHPLAAPNIIGVNSGAGLMVALVCAVAPQYPFLTPVAAFLGALAGVLLVLLIAERAGAARITLVLAGVAMSSIFSAGIDAVVTFVPDALSGYTDFRIGGVKNLSMVRLAPAFWVIVIALLIALSLSNELDLLLLGRETAQSLGLPARRLRLVLLMLAAALAGAAVSFAGLLGFVGLLVPHIMRRLLGEDSFFLLAASALGGALLLTACDLAARLLFAPYEVPLGVVLSLTGGPFFIWLLLKQRRGGGGL